MKQSVVLLAVLALAATAQEKKEVRHFEIKVDGPAGAGDHMIMTSGAPMMHIERFSAQAVKGAPYAAEATSESVQTLADGNRIVHKNTTRMFRDAEGRTRMENAIVPTGLWTPQAKDLSIILINDPVAGVHYSLNSGEKTATKVTLPKLAHSISAGAGKEVQIERQVVVHAAGAGAGAMPPAGAGPAVMVFERREGGPLKVSGSDVKRELLGKQTIEGVVCEGVRETFVIPAGQMGNEREIRSVTERWYSTELGFDVLRKTSDPRSGESTYRVTSIVRADQPRSLFEVPADYKLEETKPGNISEDVVIKRKAVKE